MVGSEIGSAYATVGFKVDESGLHSAKSMFGSTMDGLESKAKSTGLAIGKALAMGTVALGVALAGVATLGVKTYSDIESSAADAASKMDLSDIAKKSGKSIEESFKGVKEHVISLSRELGQLNTNAFDPTEIAEACANLAAGGFDVATASAKDMTPILSLATATNYGLADSSKVALATMNQFGMGVNDLGRIADVYTLAAGKSAAGMYDFDYAMQQAGPVAKGVGISFEELTAMIAKMSDMGYKGEKSGTALRTAFMKLTSPTKTQSDTLARLGLTFDDVNPKQHGFLDTLDLLIKKGADVYDFGEIYGAEGAAVVYATAQQTASIRGLTKELEGSQGAAERMAKMMLDTLGGSFDAAKGAAIDLAIGIGQDLAPAVKGFLDWFSGSGAPAIREFYKAFKEGDWKKVGEMITNGVKGGLNELSKIGNWMWQKIKPSIDALRSKIQPALEKAFAISGAYTGLKLMTAGFVMMLPAVTTVSAAISGPLVGALATSRLAFLSTWAAALAPLTGVVAGIALIGAGLAAIGYALDPGKFTIFGKAASDAFNGIKDVVTDCWTAIQAGDWGAVADRLKQAFGDAIGFVKGLDWQGLGGEVVTMIGDGAKAILDAAFALGDWIYTNATAWVTSGGPRKLGEDIVGALAAGAEALLGKKDLWLAVKGAFKVASDWLDLGWKIATGIAGGIYDKILEYKPRIYNTFVDLGAALTRLMTGVGVDIGNAIVSGIKYAQGILATFLSDAQTNAQNVYSYITGQAPTARVTEEGGGSFIAAPALPSGEKSQTAKDMDAAALASQQAAGLRGISYGTDNSIAALKKRWETEAKARAVLSEIYGGPAYGMAKPVTSGIGGVKAQSSLIDQLNFAVNPFGGFFQSGLKQAAQNPQAIAGAANVVVNPVGAITSIAKPVAESVGEGLSGPLTSWSKLELADKEKAMAESEASFHKMFPYMPDSIKEAADEGEVAAKESAALTKDAAKTAATDIKSMMPPVKSMMGDAASGILSSSQQAGQQTVTYSREAGNALSLGGGAVRMGLTASGQEIAVIGRVAQQNFTAAGNKWVSDSALAGTAHVGAVSQAATIHLGALNQGASIGINAAQQQSGVLNASASNVGGSADKVATSAMSLGDKGDQAGNALIAGATGASSLLVSGISGVMSLFSGYGNNPWAGTSIGSMGGGGGGGTINAVGSDVNLNGAIISGGQANFEDLTCLGDTVLVNALKYTSPSGYTSYINPLTYQETGGISHYQYAGQSSSGSSSGGSWGGPPAISGWSGGSPWAARGYLANRGAELIGVGERGPELVLPSDVTKTILDLTALGQVGGGGEQNITVQVFLNGRKISEEMFKTAMKRARNQHGLARK